jgi:phosphoglucosamine mutase
MKDAGKRLSQLRAVIELFPQITVNIKVREKKPIESLPKLTSAIRAAEAELGQSGRVLIRYSGTENKLRLMIESESRTLLDKHIAALKSAAEGELT